MKRDGWQGHPVESLSAFLDDELAGPEREQVASHLAACADCRTFLEDLRRLDLAVGSESPPPVPGGLARRIQDRLGETIDVVPSRPRRGWSRWLAPLPLAAASLVVATAIWLAWPPRPPASSGGQTQIARSHESRKVAPPDGAPASTPPTAPEPRPPAAELPPPAQRKDAVRSKDKVPPRDLVPPAQPAPESGRDAQPPATPQPTRQTALPERRTQAAPSPRPGPPEAPSRAQEGERVYGFSNAPAVASKSAAAATESVAFEPVVWPVAIAAPPYDVLLRSEDLMTVRTDKWICTIAIEPDDGRRLALLAHLSPPAAVAVGRPSLAADTDGEKTAPGSPAPAAPEAGGPASAAPASAAPASPAAASVARPAPTPSGEAALRLIRDRYRVLIEQRCGPPPR